MLGAGQWLEVLVLIDANGDRPLPHTIYSYYLPVCYLSSAQQRLTGQVWTVPSSGAERGSARWRSPCVQYIHVLMVIRSLQSAESFRETRFGWV